MVRSTREGKQWSFVRGKEVISANVKDHQCLDDYKKGVFRLHHTDILKVRMVERQRIKHRKVHTTYDIVEVLDYIPGHKQERLSDGG